MNQREREVVSAIESRLAEQVGPDRFGLWFSAGVRLQLSADTLRVIASAPFKLERLRRLRSQLAEAAQSVLGSAVQLSFEVDTTLATASTESSPTSSPGDAKSTNGPSGDLRRTGRPASRPNSPGPATDERHNDLPPVRGQTGRQGPRSGDLRLAGDTAAPRSSGPTAGANFAEFMVGEGNRLAVEASKATVRNLGRTSPLFIYGPSGSGKTHLLECIKSAARREARGRRVISLSAEQFTSDFLEALQGRGLPNFRRKYRDVDLLLIDDVQFFRGKRATLVELQHTVDSLQRAGRQLVLAADRAPAENNGLGRELTARMCSGLVCRIDPPDQETRRKILHRLTARYDVNFPSEVLELLATQLPGDARQLAGALNRLEAASLALRRPLTVELATSMLEDVFRATRPLLRLDDIDRAVCEVFGLETRTLQSARKSRSVSQPRMLAMFLARKHTRSALSEIGHYFGQRTHSTVISAQKKVSVWVTNQSAMQLSYGQCRVEDAIRRVEALLGAG